MKRVFIVAGKRTPIGALQGSLATVPAPQLGAVAIKGVIDNLKLDTKTIDQVIMGNVLSAGVGQNPARQASLAAGIDIGVPCFHVNKVCASGMKAIALGASEIKAGLAKTIMTGGFESMTNAPHMVRGFRSGVRFGDSIMMDSIAVDGLIDAYSKMPMGTCGEKTAMEMSITREMQDEYAIESYNRALKAIEKGLFSKNIVPVEIPKKGLVALDDEPQRFNKERIGTIKPAFADKSGKGTITAGNASKINDGAVALLLMNEEAVKSSKVTPIAEILSYADSEVQPVDFNIAPPIAAKKAILLANLQIKDIDYWEINEAFSVTAIASLKILGIPHQKCNINGGAVALGHPIGASGARIILSLIQSLSNKGEIGCAAICNGGGGASSMVIKKL